MNFILQHKLGLKYKWKIRIWGDIFNNENDKKYLKEIVANGNIALLPKLMSAEGISMRDTKAITSYIESLGFYNKFMTYTQLRASELGEEVSQEEEETPNAVGRPAIPDEDVENDDTAQSKAAGTDTADNRNHE